MYKTTIFLILLCFQISYSQVQNEFYVDDVDVIEYVTVSFCLDDEGKTNIVALVPEKTTYTNQENIAKIIEYRKSISYSADSKFNNNCYDSTFSFINAKYQNKELTESECKKCEVYKEGEFQYADIIYQDVIIKRSEDIQIETVDDRELKFKIEWQSPCEYTLTYLAVTNKESEYLIGETIYIKIIEILENGDYVYHSNLQDRTLITGVIKKIK